MIEQAKIIESEYCLPGHVICLSEGTIVWWGAPAEIAAAGDFNLVHCAVGEKSAVAKALPSATTTVDSLKAVRGKSC